MRKYNLNDLGVLVILYHRKIRAADLKILFMNSKFGSFDVEVLV
jgi:hypothetical protein